MAERDELSQKEYDYFDKEAELRAKLTALNKEEEALVRRREGISDADAERIENARSALGNQLQSVTNERKALGQQLDKKYAAVKKQSVFGDDDDDDEPEYGNRDNQAANGDAIVKAKQNALEAKTSSSTKVSTVAITNTENKVETSGGGATVRRSGYDAPEVQEWETKRAEAARADVQAQKEVNNQYLEEQGLANASPGEKLRAISKAKREGKIPTVTTNQDAFTENNPKPPIVATTERVEAEQEQKLENNASASSQTAAASVKDSPGASTGEDELDEDEDDVELDDDEKSLLDNKDKPLTSENDSPLIKDEDEDAAADLDAEEKTTNTLKPLEQAEAQTRDEVAHVVVGAEKSEDPVKTQPPPTKVEVPKTATPQVKLPNEKPEMVSTSNILHNYASSTYRLSLYMLSAKEYKTIVDTPHLWRPTNCLISGAGKVDPAGSVRHPEFKDDFYFEDFQMMTMVGLNAKSKASNALEFSFTIVEPYGISFLDRLVAASEYVGSKNYLDMPYILQLEFFGHSDDGVTIFQPIPNTLKRFPIRLLSMEIDVDTGGAKYKCQASPYNHTAYDEKIATTGVNLQVTATDVASFFRTKDGDLAQKIKAQRDIAKQAADVKKQLQGARNVTQIEALNKKSKELEASSSKGPLTTETFAAGLNAWYDYMVLEDARVHSDKVIFDIHPDIAKSKIVRSANTDHKKTPMPKAGTKEAAALARNAGQGPKFDEKGFIINAGTSVLKVIDMVMRNSEYIIDQILDPSNSSGIDVSKMSPEEIVKKLNKPFNWYKVIPSVELGEFDEKANRFAKIFTYHIVPNQVSDTKHPHGPKKKPTRFQKAYNYFYTGANHDILDFKIQFNTLYYNVVSINRSNAQTSAVTPGKSEKKDSKIINPSGGKNVTFPQQIEIQSGSKSQQGLDVESSSVTRTVNDIQRNLYQNSKADMLSLTMTIIGDPDFIKQDDLYINPKQSNYPDLTSGDKINGTGSLVMDKGEIYALVAFKTPTDYDEKTGLIRGDGKYIDTSFSGIYRIMAVVNKFRQGKFTQDIDLIRVLDHDINLAKASLVPTERQVKEAIKRNAPITSAASQTKTDLGTVTDVASSATHSYDEFGNIVGYGGADEDVGAGLEDAFNEVSTTVGSVAGAVGGVANNAGSFMSKAIGAVSGAMTVINGVSKLTSSLNGGLGSLPGMLDGAMQVGSGLNAVSGAVGGVANALPGSINELTGAVGIGYPDIDAFGGAGEIVQGVAGTMPSTNPDLAAIAALGDEIDIAGLQAEELAPVVEKATPPVILGGFAATTSSLLTASAKAKQLVEQQAKLAGIPMPNVGDINDMTGVLNSQMSALGLDPSNLEGLAKGGVNLSQLQANAGSADGLTGKLNGFVNNTLSDPNAPPYTGDDPIIRARLGLPPLPDGSNTIET